MLNYTHGVLQWTVIITNIFNLSLDCLSLLSHVITVKMIEIHLPFSWIPTYTVMLDHKLGTSFCRNPPPSGKKQNKPKPFWWLTLSVKHHRTRSRWWRPLRGGYNAWSVAQRALMSKMKMLLLMLLSLMRSSRARSCQLRHWLTCRSVATCARAALPACFSATFDNFHFVKRWIRSNVIPIRFGMIVLHAWRLSLTASICIRVQYTLYVHFITRQTFFFVTVNNCNTFGIKSSSFF